MTIEERIEQAAIRDSFLGDDAPIEGYEFTKSELFELLNQVAKEQRDICANEFLDEDEPHVRGCYRIKNAYSPLKVQ